MNYGVYAIQHRFQGSLITYVPAHYFHIRKPEYSSIHGRNHTVNLRAQIIQYPNVVLIYFLKRKRKIRPDKSQSASNKYVHNKIINKNIISVYTDTKIS